jgi:hypothetical protein
MVVYQFGLGGGIPFGTNIDRTLPPTAILIVSGMEVVATLVIRWLFIPKGHNRRTLLYLFVAGLALSESLTFFGIFLVPHGYPQTKMAFLVTSVLCIAQMAPFFLSEDEDSTFPSN